MKGFVWGAVFGVVVVLLALFLLKSSVMTGNSININPYKLSDNTEDASIRTEVKNDLAVQESSVQEFNSFRVYNMNNDSREAYLVYKWGVDDVRQKIPVIKIIPPMGDLAELTYYLKNSQFETLIIISGDISTETGVQIRRDAGISMIVEMNYSSRRKA